MEPGEKRTRQDDDAGEQENGTINGHGKSP
jgi:hypothetical protein